MKKIAKTVVLIPAILELIFCILILYCELSRKSVNIGGSYPYLIVLINIELLILGNYSACQNQLIDIDFDETGMSDY